MPLLSCLIPSRNEMFLVNTVQDLLLHSDPNLTEILVALDGWECDINETDRVRIMRFPESIGQRAATNRLAEQAMGKYLMKVDAHCSFAPGFDAIMLRDMQDDAAMVPVMKNLHVFNWVCPQGHKRYQGPSGPCKEMVLGKVCGLPTKMDIVWFAKHAPNSTAYCIDSEPHFEYDDQQKKRTKHEKISETMTLQGSCFMVSKEMYFDLNLCDEVFGSWGTQGAEVALKVWLSGGRVLCNKNTWYAHMFRTQGADFGFPYPISGNQIHAAKKYARELFFYNRWPRQVRPLSWLVEKFAPLPGWHYAKHGRTEIKHEPETLRLVLEQGATFLRSREVFVPVGEVVSPLPGGGTDQAQSPTVDLGGQRMAVEAMGLSRPPVGANAPIISGLADPAGSHPLLSGNQSGRRQEVPVNAVPFPLVDHAGSIRSEKIHGVGNQFQVDRIAAAPVFAEVIDDRNILAAPAGDRSNEPSIHSAMDKNAPDASYGGVAVSTPVGAARPRPTSSDGFDSDISKQPGDGSSIEMRNREILNVSHESVSSDSGLGVARCIQHHVTPTIPRIGLVYYSDGKPSPRLLQACQNQIKVCCNGHELTSVTLVPMDFGRNIHFEAERGYLTMFRQILRGIEESQADVIFLVEHDVLYHPSHFDFIPPRKDVFYYDENHWMVRPSDGHALFFNYMSVSALCAWRELMLSHYRARVDKVEREGFTRYFGFEPGSHRPPRGCDNYTREPYFALYPSLDIRHDSNLTSNRWRKDQYRNQKQLYAWREDNVWNLPGWTREQLREVFGDAIPAS